MPSRVTDLHVARNVPLPSPARLQAEIPRGDQRADFVAQSRAHLRSLLSGNDPRFLVIVGPCSIHDTEAGLEYAHRLAAVSRDMCVRAVRDALEGGLRPVASDAPSRQWYHPTIWQYVATGLRKGVW